MLGICMKLKFLLSAFISLIIITTTFSQVKKSDKSPLAAYKVGNLWYFINNSGEQIFPAIELKEVGGYSEGFFRVKKLIEGKEKVCFLNMKGETSIICDCDKAKDFSDGMAVIMKYTTDAHDDMVYGYINKEGKQVLPPKFMDATGFVRGMAYILDKDKRGYIDKTGNYLILLQNAVGSQFYEGMATVSNEHYKSGFINKNGDLVIDYKFDEAGDFSVGLAVVGLNGKYGYIDKNGAATVITLFDEAFDFSEGLSAVRKDRKWGYVDKSGEYVLESKYSSAGSFINGLAWVSNDDTKEYGFIDRQGNIKIKIPEPEMLIDLRLNKYVFDSK